MGDTALQITIQPGTTERELQRIEQVVQRIDDRKNRQAKEVEELDRKTKDQAGQLKAKTDQAMGPTGGSQLADKARRFLDRTLGTAQAAATLFEGALPVLGTAISSAGKDIDQQFGGLGMFEKFAAVTNEKIQRLADEVTKGRAFIDALRPTMERAVEFSIASLRLGGKLPEDQDVLLKSLWTIANKQEQMARNMKRDVNNETVRLLFEGVKQAAGGGR